GVARGAQKASNASGINLIVILQQWLLTAPMNAWLGGDSSVTWPAAVASLGCFLVNLGLLRRVFHLHKAGTEMAGSVRARAGLSVRDLSPNIFAIVMAAG